MQTLKGGIVIYLSPSTSLLARLVPPVQTFQVFGHDNVFSVSKKYLLATFLSFSVSPRPSRIIITV